MTNIIILSSVLVTNWDFTVTLAKPNESNTAWGETHQNGTVIRITSLGMKTGTNVVFIGNFECVAGSVRKTNALAGPMIPWKEEK